MAEAFGIAAGVIGVVSLSIQLADGVQKACDFCESIEDGPEDIERISAELRLLSNCLQLISHEHQSGMADPSQDSLVLSALRIAKKDINELSVFVTELTSKINPGQGKVKRKWGRVKIALSAAKIAKMKTHVESAKSTLNMLQASRTQIAITRLNGEMALLSTSFSTITQSQPRVEHQNRRLLNTKDADPQSLEVNTQDTDCVEAVSSTSESLRRANASSLESRTKTTWTSINAGIARLSFQSSSTTFAESEEDQNDEKTPVTTKKTFVVNLLWGFSSCRRGFRLSANSPFDSLNLNTIRRRPNDSQIFTLCLSGDAKGVQKLLGLRQASLFDADETGRGLLHIACRNGSSEVAKLLMRSGIDCYMRSDSGQTVIDELEYYDMECTTRENIVGITDTLVRETTFDPFDYPQDTGYQTLVLSNGLPKEILKYLLLQDYHLIPARGIFIHIYENLLGVTDFHDEFQESVDLMLTKYEKMMQDPVTCAKWSYRGTLLQYFIAYWMFDVFGHLEAKFKISRCLLLTEDLYAEVGSGTPLDTIARLGQERIQPWLELLAINGIDTAEYLEYESDQHPDGIVYQGLLQCCRIIHLHFRSGQDGITGVEVENVCDSQYDHFHPEFRCKAQTSRARCITQLHDVVIDGEGKPKQSIPGGWSAVLKPNSESFLVNPGPWTGKQYVDVLKPTDLVWNETSGGWD